MNAAAFYDQVFAWTLCQLIPGRPFVLGMNGPQGGGKSTLAAALCARAEATGRKAIAISVDDFYLTRAEQEALAQAHPTNPYLQQRGYPGTHDLVLGTRKLDELRNLALGLVRVPRYDKGAFQGRGDRAPPSAWAEARTPLDLVVFEGWMLGFTPVAVCADPALAEVNRALAGYSVWVDRLDGFLHLDPEEETYVLDWRVEAEEQRKATGQAGLTTAEARAYIEKFLPAYRLWLPGLRARASISGPALRIEIGRNRLPLTRQRGFWPPGSAL